MGLIAPLTYPEGTSSGFGYIHFISSVAVFVLDRIAAKQKN